MSPQHNASRGGASCGPLAIGAARGRLDPGRDAGWPRQPMPHSVTAALARRALSTGDERTHAREYAVERCLAEHLGGRVEP